MKTEEEIEKEEEKLKIKKRWMIFAFIVTVIFIALTPYLFTQFSTGIDFKDKGEIGDAIGGITAPFINIMAALLIYYSFNEQVKANKIQSGSLDKMKIQNRDAQLTKIVFEDSKTIMDMIESFELSSDYLNKVVFDEEVTKSYFGIQGVFFFIEFLLQERNVDLPKNYLPHELNLMLLLNNKVNLLLIHLDKISDNDTKEIYLERYYFQIHSTLFSQVDTPKGSFKLEQSNFYYSVWVALKGNVESYKEVKESLS